MTRRLDFVEPVTAAFVAQMAAHWNEGRERTRIVGYGELPDRLRNEACERGVECVDLAQAQLVVLTEPDGRKLSRELLACVELSDVAVIAPISSWHFSERPLFVLSIPKAGTHLAFELATALGYRPGVELPQFPINQTWYCLEYSNSHTMARDFFVDSVRRAPFGNRHHPFPRSPVLFMYRHPLDILVSEAHYYNVDGKSLFAGYFAGCDFEERIQRLLNDDDLLGAFAKRTRGFLPWFDFPNVIPVSFEELVGVQGGGRAEDQERLVWSIQLKLQVPGDPADIASRLFRTDSATFREGQAHSYTKYLSAKFISAFTAEHRELLDRMGYSSAGQPGVPAKARSRALRPIDFASVDFECMPLTIESDFLGCNLVRYDRRIYAVPMVAGPVHLEKLSDPVRNSFPSANSLSEVKALLLLGANDLRRRQSELAAFAQAVRSEAAPPSVAHSEPGNGGSWTMLCEYRGFNLVRMGDRYLGLRQSLGPIDLTAPLESIAVRYSPRDVVNCRSMVSLRDEIDGLSTAARKPESELTSVLAAIQALEQAVEATRAENLELGAAVRGLLDDLSRSRKEWKETEQALKDEVNSLRAALGAYRDSDDPGRHSLEAAHPAKSNANE